MSPVFLLGLVVFDDCSIKNLCLFFSLSKRFIDAWNFYFRGYWEVRGEDCLGLKGPPSHLFYFLSYKIEEEMKGLEVNRDGKGRILDA